MIALGAALQRAATADSMTSLPSHNLPGNSCITSPCQHCIALGCTNVAYHRYGNGLVQDPRILRQSGHSIDHVVKHVARASQPTGSVKQFGTSLEAVSKQSREAKSEGTAPEAGWTLGWGCGVGGPLRQPQLGLPEPCLPLFSDPIVDWTTLHNCNLRSCIPDRLCECHRDVVQCSMHKSNKPIMQG